MSDIVQKLWSFCHTLRHDGVEYGTAYIHGRRTTGRDSEAPGGYRRLRQPLGGRRTQHNGSLLNQRKHFFRNLGCF